MKVSIFYDVTVLCLINCLLNFFSDILLVNDAYVIVIEYGLHVGKMFRRC